MYWPGPRFQILPFYSKFFQHNKTNIRSQIRTSVLFPFVAPRPPTAAMRRGGAVYIGRKGAAIGAAFRELRRGHSPHIFRAEELHSFLFKKLRLFNVPLHL